MKKTGRIKTKHAAWSAAFTAAVIAIVVVANLFAGLAESKFSLTADMTGNDLYVLSDDTKEFLGSMNDDFTISVLSDEIGYSQGVRTGIINEILKKYESSSKGHIKIQYIDTYTNPAILSKYQNESIEENGLIIEGNEGYSIISMSDMFTTQVNESSLTSQVTDCKAEQVLSSALIKLSADTQPKIYLIEGHGETYYEKMTERITSGSYKCENLSLTTGSVPEDADLIIVSAPQSDFSAEELLKLDDYLKNAGNMIFLYGSESPRLANINRYLEEWGVVFDENIIVDPSRYIGNGIQISPELADAEINSKCMELTDRFLLTPGARSISIIGQNTGTRELAPVLTTSSAAYAKSYANEAGLISTVEKEAGDAEGIMNVGVLVTSAAITDKKAETGMILFLSSPAMFSDSLLETSNLLNDYYFANTLSYMTGGTAQFVSIPSKNMKDSTLSTVGTSSGMLMILVVVIPSLLILLAGLLKWRNRRKL